MSFSSSDRPNPALSSIYKSVLSQFEEKLVTRLNVEQMFLLIDGLLPFEACLYHQVLPLFVEGSRFSLGMVNPDDVAATDYVRRMISYVHYSLVIQQISSTALQTTLSSYLNYVSIKRSQTAEPPKPTRSRPEPDPEPSWTPSTGKATDLSDRQTFILDESSLHLELENSAQSSLPIEDSDQSDANSYSIEETPLSLAVEPVLEIAEPQDSIPDSAPEPTAAEVESDAQSLPRTPPVQRSADSKKQKQSTFPLLSPPRETSVQVLQLQANHRKEAIEQLGDRLNPNLLLQELLVRVLETGIGRLYFERQKHSGRVLWSESGVLKAVLGQLKPDYCQALINELKLLVHIPLLPVDAPQQSEVERIYGNERILLRCRFMRGVHGEEATLQVLRGAALRFYEQQQIDRLGNDALVLARELHKKLTEIRGRVRIEPTSARGSLNKLLDLQQALNYISTEIQDLQSIQDYDPEP